MKKLHIKNIVLFLLVFNLTSCENDFLDEPQPATQVSSEVVFGSKKGINAYMSGIIRYLRADWSSVDSSGFNAMLYARSVKGNDVINKATWYQWDYENINREPTWRRPRFSWTYPYIIIDETNHFIRGVEATTAVEESFKTQMIAQAKAIRAYFYFQLALEFQHAYNYDPSLSAPPLYKEPASVTGPKGMSTLQEMYDFILEDLTFAVENLSTDRISKSYVNVNVANGMLAQVYQTMNNWTGAEEAARKAYGGSPSSVLHPEQYNNGFDDIAESDEWMWGMAQTEDQNQGWAGAPHVIADHRVLTYYGTYFNNDFVALFSDTDVRNLFENRYGGGDNVFWRWVSNKFAFTFACDVPFMRTAEMILIEAEAKYHNGDAAGAHNLLFALQSNRDPEAVKSTNTGTALLDEILVERRKELYAENGVEWFDAKRYRKGITRTGNHRIGTSASLTPDDKRFFLKVPQEEIDSNEFIDDSVNADR
ncbi:RagB/SusD family nutrient uptake outer membrane protein [Aquimarina sp. AU58]|uniref:RagB/SusD family nutrient uptake outer membrane protein n=1 Tax=Aquimarina sp. AU58 TaxID=1874112 RepID=UPI000D6E5AF6|nr:RagB/SusD family nutrient uptake outer membrane protein [Aquimarina sp. AU58]